MKRLDQILAEMASAPEDELGRLLAEARASTQQRQGIAAGMTDGGVHHPRANGRHCEGAKRPEGLNGKDADPEGPASFQGGSRATTNTGGVGALKSRKASAFAYRVIINPAMPTMDMDRGVALPHVRKAPRAATPRPMLIVIEGGRH